MTKFMVQLGDVLDVPSDLLLLKYAQNFYGADAAVARRLLSQRLCVESEISPKPGDFIVVETKGSIASTKVMFLGTPPLHSFTYEEMEVFALSAIEKITAQGLLVQTLTTTVHGTGYGLDGGESLQRLVLGFREGLSKHNSPVEKIIFLTLGERAERMLSAVLDSMYQEQIGDIGPDRSSLFPSAGADKPQAVTEEKPDLGSLPESSLSPDKRRVFVAMPFSEEFQNVYEFAIYPAVRNCGFICERVDQTPFTGDVLGRIRDGIESASLVIADLTEGRPNVYLEVGYAWGRGVPVIFVARKKAKLHFDVSTHKCIFYGRFTQFANELETLIRGIGP